MPHTSKMTVPLWRNLWQLYARQKPTSSFMISLKYFNMTNWSVILAYLLWLLWECLAMHTQSDTLYLQKLPVFTSMGKINFMLFWRYRKESEKSCQKSEKTNVTFVMKLLNWWIDGQTDGRTGNSDFVGNSDLERESSY